MPLANSPDGCEGVVIYPMGGKYPGTPYCTKCLLWVPFEQVSEDDFSTNSIHRARPTEVI